MRPRDLFNGDGLRWQFFVLKDAFSFYAALIKDEMDIWHQEIRDLDLCNFKCQRNYSVK